MIYPHAKFYVTSCGSLIYTISERKAECILGTATMIFYILQTHTHIFLQSHSKWH